MLMKFETLSLQDAKRMLAAGEAKADEIGIPYNIAVVDAGGRLLAFARQDGALIGSIDLGKIVIFGGGLPIKRNSAVIGAVGASAGTVEQDIEVAHAAIQAIQAAVDGKVN